MLQAQQTLNQVLVTLFNDILRIEERTLKTPGLTIREIHVIEAVCLATDSRITRLARDLHVTNGSMSVAISTLERKGFLRRETSEQDRRTVLIHPTEKALQVQCRHQEFHQEMVEAVIAHLQPEELRVLVTALDRVDQYFTNKESEHS